MVLKVRRALGENFALAPVFFAYLLVTAVHAVMSADDYDVHKVDFPFINDLIYFFAAVTASIIASAEKRAINLSIYIFFAPLKSVS